VLRVFVVVIGTTPSKGHYYYSCNTTYTTITTLFDGLDQSLLVALSESRKSFFYAFLDKKSY
jgi:hypothetical protein